MAVELQQRALGGRAPRFVIAAGVNTCIYVGLTLLLSHVLGVPMQLAITLSFVTATCTHFLLQRFFVFRTTGAFELSTRAQAARYVVIAVVQYAITSVATAVLPGRLNVSEQLIYVGVVGTISVTTFLLLRARVFHADTA